MGPMGGHSVLDQDDRWLLAAREAFPEWDIIRVFGGYLAVPQGAPVIQSIDADGIVEKIRLNIMHANAQRCSRCKGVGLIAALNCRCPQGRHTCMPRICPQCDGAGR